jgi:uncharacterized repeat protein (TIGR03837 family)
VCATFATKPFWALVLVGSDISSVVKNQKKVDIFCKIVDNFGDIGVCWRLAKQLRNEHGLPVRLFVDDLSIAEKILIGLRNEEEQMHDGVSIIRWGGATQFTHVADVVVETFACGLPSTYLRQMQVETMWVNVEHLSAEAWVPEFHALSGKHHETNFKRHFYFPGFNEQAGGLLREQDLITRRNDFQQSDEQQSDFWNDLNITHANDLKISLFSYANAPVNDFLQSLVEGEQQVSVYIPFNNHLPTSLLGSHDLVVGDCIKSGNLTLQMLPFLSQEDYDYLLWACDINFVRGEDSWVRAIWSGQPFIWQPYWQEGNVHLLKLNAFLDGFYTHPDIDRTLMKLHESWSTEVFHHHAWQDYLTKLGAVSEHTKQQSNRLIQQDDLATRLLAFCANLAD